MSKNKFALIILALIIIIHGFILTKLIFFPYPELFIYPYLTNHGLKPYSQILDQHFPGLMFLPINFDNLGMTNESVARIWLISIVLITHVLLFLISNVILKSGKKALLVNVLYLIWQPFFEGWVLWIDNFLPILLLPAFYALTKKRFFTTGILLGLGIVFKQTIIPLSLLILIYTIWSESNLPKTLRYFIGLIFPIILMLLYFIFKGILADFWYWTIVFNLTVFAFSGTQIPHSFGFISRVLLVYLSSLVGFFHQNERTKIILFLFLLGSLVGAFDRANFVHFQPSLPFAIISTVLGIYALGRNRIALMVVVFYLIIAAWWQNIFYKGHLSNKIFFFDDSTYKAANKIMQYTKPREKIFVFGAAPHLYQMSETLPAGDIFVFQFPWFFEVAQNRILEGVEKDKPNITVVDRTVKIDDQQITEFGSAINQYLTENYEKIDIVGDTEILRRK